MSRYSDSYMSRAVFSVDVILDIKFSSITIIFVKTHSYKKAFTHVMLLNEKQH